MWEMVFKNIVRWSMLLEHNRGLFCEVHWVFQTSQVSSTWAYGVMTNGQTLEDSCVSHTNEFMFD